jgi:hypothetical protein
MAIQALGADLQVSLIEGRPVNREVNRVVVHQLNMPPSTRITPPRFAKRSTSDREHGLPAAGAEECRHPLFLI